MPDPIRKRFGFGQLWPLRPACSQNRPASVLVPCFVFCFVFQRRPGSYCAKPTQIRSGWPGFGPHSEHRFSAPSSLKEGCGKPVLGVWVWPNTSGQETSWCAGIIWPGFWQDVTDPLPVSLFPTRFRYPQTSRLILCKTSPDLIWFCLTVSGLGQTEPVRKQASVQKLSGPLLANASQPIRTGFKSDPACLLATEDSVT